MLSGITPPSTDTQTKISVLDKVKSAVSGMPGKLRDIFNTMIPGRTGSFTLPKSWSPQSSFASSMAGAFSTRGSVAGTGPGKHAVQHPISLFSGRTSPAPDASESASWLYGEGLRHIATPVSVKDVPSPWKMSQDEIARSDAPHVLEDLPSHGNRSPADFGMPRGRLIPRISQDSQSRSSVSSNTASLSEFDFLDAMSESSKA